MWSYGTLKKNNQYTERGDGKAGEGGERGHRHRWRVTLSRQASEKERERVDVFGGGGAQSSVALSLAGGGRTWMNYSTHRLIIISRG